MTKETNIFERLGLPRQPLMLAPLAGVSDHPFRRICTRHGADLTYVEMLSAAALLSGSKRTLGMMVRHPEEKILGVQVTGRTPEEVGAAVKLLDEGPFDTIDLNMGCPVQKVTKSGCGSAILRDPKRVYETVLAARANTKKPLSAKIRLGWDRQSLNGTTVASAVADAGADWLTVHGRTRSCDYSDPVDLEGIAAIKEAVAIPVIGNGNLFTPSDAQAMMRRSALDGLMVSRGALGNPWVFAELKTGVQLEVDVGQWWESVLAHLQWHEELYGTHGAGTLCMRKHILWYLRGWPGGKATKEKVLKTESMSEVQQILREFALEIGQSSYRGAPIRRAPVQVEAEGRFAWDPKYDMDRQLDRGVGHEGLDSLQAPPSNLPSTSL